jgi:hypothetical protein
MPSPRISASPTEELAAAWARYRPSLAFTTRDRLNKTAGRLVVAAMVASAAARRIERWGHK